VNDREVSQPVQLHHGDLIQLADVVFKFHVPDEAAKDDQVQVSASEPTLMVIQRTPSILLVADIVSYSSLSETLGQDNVTLLLNAWYDDCTAIMTECGGRIDKFIGDCVFGLWKNTGSEARGQAVRAAALLASGPRNLPDHLRQLMEDCDVKIRCGVGLHIGEPNVGAVARGTRTALGDDVNLTFRIEAKTREVGRPILASGAFLEGWELGSTLFTPCGPQELKGFPSPVELFALTGKG
jgi:adenylate cyclase